MLLVLVAAVDYATGEELSFFVFYFIPVSFAAWTLGLKSGVASAILATAGWLGVESISGHQYSQAWLIFANALIRGFSYALMACFVAKLKQSRLELGRYALELETMVENRTAKLRERVSELEMFSYSVSHNLRAPLRAVDGMAHLIDESLPQGAKNGEIGLYLRQIRSAAVRMDNLVVDLVEYVQLTICEPELRPTYLGPLISAAVDAHQELIASSGAQVTATPWEGAVWGNSRVLSSALSEIVGNALKFAAPGRAPVVAIRVDDSASDFVRISVSDNGVGIAPEHQQRIFGLFEQLHASDRFGGGTGMGLPAAKKAVEKLGGRMEVHSEGEGFGATFCLSVPKYQTGQRVKKGE